MLDFLTRGPAGVKSARGDTIEPDGDTLRLYYGAADTCVALATGSIRQMLDWLDRHGRDTMLGVD